MQILRCICVLLKVCGCSPPPIRTSPYKKFLYSIYTGLVFSILYTLAIFQLLDLVLIVDNQDDFSDNFYTTSSIIVTCFKMCNLLLTRRNIEFMIGALQKEPFLPQNVEETSIRTRFDKITEWNTIVYMIMIESCMIFIFVATFLMGFESRKLVFRAWTPYNYTSTLVFSLTYVHQIMAATVCSLSTVACDGLFNGLLIHIYCQFEIFEHRLHNIERDKSDSLKRCVYHHNHIYKFATMVNDEFKVIMFLQYLMSSSTICFDLYRLSQINTTSKLIQMITYAMCTLTQIFYYCWYGNEVKLKSLEISDIIFSSNWYLFDKKSKKIFLMMMRRALEPIEFTSSYIVSIDLDSFKALLKTSYSAFNVLQQTK